MSERAVAIDDILIETYPDAHCELDFASPFQLLVATVLSAQTTDVRVNQVTPELFNRYPRPADLASAGRADVEEILRPLGFFRAKTTSLIELSGRLVAEFSGDMPDSLDALVSLPGVGRKTANVVLGNAFGIPGITVDTHVGRLSRRLGLTKNTDPVKVERDLMAELPKERWTDACHRLIFHGRRCCTARKPDCEACPLSELCPRIGV
ncbi:endonuclease III [Bowdeniella nasicola]|uniref:Endonuclease III n=1 Tax=Bowdeniella nasicola TaxID=208480 RepID=A0A1Q5Q454_9ACTO|nr:endonuclease III [Bowdeniella nasicola]OKL54586.1 endonuclease III [Bowdeniella nasicola]